MQQIPTTKKINNINKVLLRFVLLFGNVYTRLGANLPQLTSILTYKLMMDDRRPNTFSQMRPQKNKDAKVSGQTWRTILLSAFMGLLYLLAFVYSSDITSGLFLYFGLYIFMLASSLITDFTSVLIDIRDNFIIMPKPVSDRTVVLARLLHILIHVSKLVLPMSVPGIVLMVIGHGIWGGFVFLIMVLMATLFTIFIVNALYILILRFTSAAKFQNIIATFQIILSIALYAFYQIGPRMIGSAKLGVLNPYETMGLLAAPPYWFAACWGTITGNNSGGIFYVLTAMALLLPLISIWAVVKYLAPAFNQKLSMIGGSTVDIPKQASGKTIQRIFKKTIAERFSNFFLYNKEEKMAFRFTWIMMGRSRDFKLKTYPGMGYLLVMMVVIFFGRGKTDRLHQIMEGGKATMLFLVMATYLSSMMISTVLTNIIYSDKYKAGWWYFTTPLQKPGLILSGALKAALVKFYMPIALFISGVMFILLQPVYYLNVLLAISNQLFLTALFVLIGVRHFPFSQVQGNNEKGGTFLRAMLMLVITGLLGFIQYYYVENRWVMMALLIVILTGFWLLVRQVQQTSWQKVKSVYNEQ